MLAPVLFVFAAAAIFFAQAQNVWVDESTQLSGMTLAPGTLFAWLSGAIKLPLGVPEDRMPPLSYLVDIVGWHLWGANALAFRLYHAAIAGAGIALLVVALARRLGARTALIAGFILALSPKLVEVAVEIRAYPLFLALSCAQLALILGGGVAARPMRLVLFLLLGLMSGYTHFFGVVASSAFTLAVFLDARDVRAAIRVVLGYALLLLLWGGLAPFILGAASISPTGQAAGAGLADIAAFLLQTLTNSAVMIYPPVALAYFAGLGLLVLLGAIGLGRIVAREGIAARHDPLVGIAAALAAGIAVILAAALVVRGFSVLSPRYNLWMMPAAAILVAAAADGLIAPAGRIARHARRAGLLLFAAGALGAQAVFLWHSGWFVHGPPKELDGMMARSAQPLAVVHVGDGWPWTYFPFFWRYREALPQWQLAPDGRSVSRILRDSAGAPGTPLPFSALEGYGTLLVARTELKTFEDLREIGWGTAPPPFHDELAPALGAAGWQAGRSVYRPGNFTFTAQLYDRRSSNRPSGPRLTDGSE